MHRHCAATLIAATALTAFAAHAAAVGPTPQSGLIRERTGLPVMVTIPAGIEHQFRTDIRRGGAFDVTRGTVGLGVRTGLPGDIGVSLRFTYSLDAYDFRGNGQFGEGWDDIHTLNIGAVFSHEVVTDWTIFGGPAFQFARESGASWGDGFIGGGFAGVTYRHSEDLTIGGGLGVVSQIKDSARVFPIIVLNWQITDELALTSSTAAAAAGDAGVELVYEFAPRWEAALGGATRYRRFRLDDGAPAPDGVGQDRNLPIWGRVSYAFTDAFRTNLYAGVTIWGSLRMEDSRGNRIARQNYDPAPFIGISGSLEF
jgi:hypothetical protein